MTLTNTIELALSSEVAERNASELKGAEQFCVG